MWNRLHSEPRCQSYHCSWIRITTSTSRSAKLMSKPSKACPGGGGACWRLSLLLRHLECLVVDLDLMLNILKANIQGKRALFIRAHNLKLVSDQ